MVRAISLQHGAQCTEGSYLRTEIALLVRTEAYVHTTGAWRAHATFPLHEDSRAFSSPPEAEARDRQERPSRRRQAS